MSQPIDSLARVLSVFRHFADSLRSAYFLPGQTSTINKNLQAFLLIDSIEWNSYSLLAAMDYSRIIPSGNKDKFWQEEVRKRMPTNPSSYHFASPYFNRLWLFYLRGAYDAQLRRPDSSQIKEMGFTRFALDQVESNKLNKRLKKSVLTQLMADILNMYTYRTLEENKTYDTLITEIKSIINDEVFIDEFDQQYSQKRAILLAHKKGQKAPDFRLFDSTGKEYRLEDFRGKITLLDIWASWCMPCIREFPYLHKLQERFRDEDRFQLLSVSIDARAKDWKVNGLLKHRPPGLTMWVGENSTFTERYNISLIPILLLLDDKGNFIEFNPPRASSGDQLYQLIKDRIEML
jgi:thiol-disulfide isomerase/thioredoxin